MLCLWGCSEGDNEVFCGGFDVNGLVDDLSVGIGVGGGELVAAALDLQGEGTGIVGKGTGPSRSRIKSDGTVDLSVGIWYTSR